MTNQSPQPDDIVGRLVRLADPGPEIPWDGATKIKQAIRPTWLSQVRRRTATRYTVWGASLAAAASLIAFFVLPRSISEPPQPVGHIELARGTIEVTAIDGKDVILASLQAGDHAPIEAGSRISTGATSRAAIILASGSSLRLDVGTTLQLLSPNVAVLDRGGVYAVADDVQESLEIRTDLGVARDIGTRFEIRREDAGVIIRVREGAVALSTRADELRVDRGMQLEVARDGSRRSSSIAAGAAEWSWVHTVTPPFRIEGRSVSTFLSWVSRETGAAVHYEDREAELAAMETVLHGSLGDLRPDEAAEVILPSAGLGVRREPSGMLVVARLGTKRELETTK